MSTLKVSDVIWFLLWKSVVTCLLEEGMWELWLWCDHTLQKFERVLGMLNFYYFFVKGGVSDILEWLFGASFEGIKL